MTDLSITTLVPQGEVLKNTPIANSAVDARIECLFCGWKQVIRFNARHVALLANTHFRRADQMRLCKKRR